MWYERDIDALMHRTRRRPIPAGRIAPQAALAFGVSLSVGSVLVLWLATNLAAATVLALSIAFYVFVYHDVAEAAHAAEHRDRRGGRRVSGADWLGSRTGSVDVLPLLLFGIVFLWTPPHFWALSL